MINLSDSILIEISEKDYEECLGFGHDVTLTTFGEYINRNQSNLDKIREDHIGSKISELATWKFLSPMVPRVKDGSIKFPKPDLNIYDGYKKSWRFDLSVYEEQQTDIEGIINKTYIYKIVVKHQTLKQAISLIESYTFQAGAVSGKKDPILDEKKQRENDYVAFCLVDNKKVYIRAFLPARDCIRRIFFSEPIKKQLIGEKIVIKFEDLKNHFGKSLIRGWWIWF